MSFEQFPENGKRFNDSLKIVRLCMMKRAENETEAENKLKETCNYHYCVTIVSSCGVTRRKCRKN